MDIWLRRSIWNRLVGLSILIIPIIFASLTKLYTVWNKLHELGSIALVAFSYLMGLCVALLIPLCLFFALVPIFWFSFSMWMTSFWLAVLLPFFISLSPLCLTSLQWMILGDLHYFLGLQVTCTPTGIFLSHQKYAADLLHKFHLHTTNLLPLLLLLAVPVSYTHLTLPTKRIV